MMLAHRSSEVTLGKRKLHTPREDTSPVKRLQQFRYEKRAFFTSPTTTAEQIKTPGETDLRRRVCRKNPGHRSFVSIDHFNVSHLPPAYHDQDIVDCVRALSNLTVQVNVQHHGEEKSDACPAGQCPFESSTNKNLEITMATGLVYKVHTFSNRNTITDKSCTCKECKKSPTPKTEFAYIVVQTTAHVVGDHIDNPQITSHLFFDKGERPDVCWGIVTLNNVLRVESLMDSDRCKITYVSHDVHLAARLEKMLVNWQNLRGTIMTKYLTSRSSQALPSPLSGGIPDKDRPLTIIVSHPHGCSKHVSVGHCVSRDELGNGLTRYSYNAATCPGSSGARLLIVGQAWWWWYSDHIHGGNTDATWEVSSSGPGSDHFP